MLGACGSKGSSSKKDDEPEEAEKPSPSKASRLTNLAKGTTWKGPYGTVALKDDGTVDVDIGNCGYSNESPGFVKIDPPDRCSREKQSGKLELRSWEIAVGQPDGSAYLFGGYLDSAGKLHLAVLGDQPKPQPMSEERKGSIDISMFEKLTLGKTCEIEHTLKETSNATPCRWEEKDGRTLLLYERPSRFEEGKKEEVGLVFLKDEGIIVPPVLLEMVFEKS